MELLGKCCNTFLPLKQLTVDGVIGQIGVSALSLVEEPTTPEQGYAIIQLQPMVVPIASVMHLKWDDVTKIHAQVSNDC